MSTLFLLIDIQLEQANMQQMKITNSMNIQSNSWTKFEQNCKKSKNSLAHKWVWVDWIPNAESWI